MSDQAEADPTPDQYEMAAELAYWKRVAQERAGAIESLHEFNYWHEAAVARGEVIAGLEASVAAWRARAEAARPRPVLDVVRGVLRRVRRAARR